jgi:hypothetical protein
LGSATAKACCPGARGNVTLVLVPCRTCGVDITWGLPVLNVETEGIVGILRVCMGVAEVDDPSFTLLTIAGEVVAIEIGVAVLNVTLLGICCMVAWPTTDDIVVEDCPPDLFFGAARSTGAS